MHLTPQNELVVRKLRRDGFIDRDWAHDQKVTYRLAARIWELKKLGFDFRAEEDSKKNCFYYLTRDPEKVVTQPQLIWSR